MFASLLGTLFFILYLCQRKNYKHTYSFLSLVQNEIFKSISAIPKNLYEKNIFTTRKYGADFYTLLIQNIINATMLAIGIVFLFISQSVSVFIAGISSIIGFVLMVIVLQLIRHSFEQKGGKKYEKR